MWFKFKIYFLVVPAVLLLDQFTKFFVLQKIALGDRIAVIPGFFDLVHYRNTGAAFGIFANLSEAIRAPFFYVISFVALGILAYSLFRLETANRFYVWPLSLITSGVLGNLIDRIRFGNVVDFLSVHIRHREWLGIPLEWPAFNVADSAITVSVVWMSIQILRGK